MTDGIVGLLAQVTAIFLSVVLLPFVLTMNVDGLLIGVRRRKWLPLVLALAMSAATLILSFVIRSWGLEQAAQADPPIPADFDSLIDILLPVAVGLALAALLIRLIRRKAYAG